MTYNETLGFDIDTNLDLSDFASVETHDDNLQVIIEKNQGMMLWTTYETWQQGAIMRYRGPESIYEDLDF